MTILFVYLNCLSSWSDFSITNFMSLRVILKVFGNKKEGDRIHCTFRICEPTITGNKKLQVQIQHKYQAKSETIRNYCSTYSVDPLIIVQMRNIWLCSRFCPEKTLPLVINLHTTLETILDYLTTGVHLEYNNYSTKFWMNPSKFCFFVFTFS